MKTATVADLRNHFPEIARLIEDGEAVTITKRGVAIAMLTPIRQKKTPKPVDWQARLHKVFPGGAVEGEAQEVIAYDRGDT
jgi:prevent-host-death family protein